MTSAFSQLQIIRFLVIVLMTTLLVLLAIMTINVVVDPFAMYAERVDDTHGAAMKPAIYSRVRLFKSYEVARVAPQTLILGGSRTHVGLRCTHEVFATLAGPCYNLAFDGATTKEMYAYLVHAQAIRPLKTVILGLDSYHATPATAMTRPDFDPWLLHAEGLPAWMRYVTADLRLLASFATLKASYDTWLARRHAEPNRFALDGQRLGEVYFRNYEARFKSAGPRAYFEQYDRQEILDQGTPAPQTQALDTVSVVPDPHESSLAYIQRIIDFCRARQIDLRIFVTPAHVHQLEITAQIWGNQAINDNRQRLAMLLDADARAHSELPALTAIDFSGYSAVTTEALPPQGSKDELHYYWDSSHFKDNVGDLVLDRLFRHTTPGRVMPPDFGVALDVESLPQYRAQQEVLRKNYLERSRADINALRAMVPGLPILVYHQFRSPRHEPWGEGLTITLDAFAAQMKYLHDHGYRTLSAQETLDYINGKVFPGKIVALHIDDGWKSALDAVPVLKRYGLKASFWIIAGAGHDIGSPHMDWDEIVALSKNPNFDIMAHTMTHPWKDGTTLIDWVDGKTPDKHARDAQWEMTESKRLLEQKLGRQVPYLAWPRGLYNDKLVALAKMAGYQALFTIDPGFNHAGDNPFFLRRIMIDGRCDMALFKATLLDGVARHCAP